MFTASDSAEESELTKETMNTELVKEITNARNELDRLERKYKEETPACSNTNCNFHRAGYRFGKCSWSVLLEECKDYLPE